MWELVRRQHDVVSHEQLRAHGCTPAAIKHRIRTGRLFPKAHGVYAVGTPNLTRNGERMVAVLRCGTGAVLSSLSAAVLCGLRKWEPPQYHVTVPARRRPRAPGIKVSRRNLPPHDLGEYDGIPITSPLRTILDCADELRNTLAIESMINNADARDLLSAAGLGERLTAYDGEPGVPPVREILDRDLFVLTDSELERLFVPIARAAGLERPQTQVHVNGWRVDFYFPSIDLVVECDSLRYHRTPIEQRRDRLRDQAHAAAGTERTRYTHWQIARERAYVIDHLARVAGRLRSRTPSYTRGS